MYNTPQHAALCHTSLHCIRLHCTAPQYITMHIVICEAWKPLQYLVPPVPRTPACLASCGFSPHCIHAHHRECCCSECCCPDLPSPALPLEKYNILRMKGARAQPVGTSADVWAMQSKLSAKQCSADSVTTCGLTHTACLEVLSASFVLHRAMHCTVLILSMISFAAATGQPYCHTMRC